MAVKLATVGDAPAQKVWDAAPVGTEGEAVAVTLVLTHAVAEQPEPAPGLYLT